MKTVETIYGLLIHLGRNMWAPHKAADHVRCDEKVWQEITEHMADVGANMLVIDLGEALFYPSHPELAVKGTWSPEKMRTELKRLRGLGIEPIPKLNFSTSHDAWLKDYSRMISTDEYYKVVSDVIRDTADIFDRPRFFHLGYDEESAEYQKGHLLAICRNGELWWHDLLWFVNVTEKTGCRPWMWSDYIWDHKNEYLRRMPRSVLQSNWYYGTRFNSAEVGQYGKCIDAYEWLDKAGFDQVPTGSNWCSDVNFRNTVDFCDTRCDASRIKGYLMAPWTRTFASHEAKATEAIAQMSETIKSRERRHADVR